MTDFTPYPYQEVGINFLQEKHKGILGDDMGVGKSVQALISLDRSKAYPALIICPSSLRYNWEKEIKKFLPGVTYAIVEGNKEQRKSIIEGNQQITITHYDVIGPRSSYTEVAGEKVASSVNSMHMLDLAQHKYKTIITDEAHKYRSYKSKTFAGLKHIVHRSEPENIWQLSGTPIVNSATDVWPMLHLIDPAKYSSFWKWVMPRFQIGNKWNKYAIGECLDPEALRQELEPYMLRREKRDVLTELPPVTYENIDIALSSQQRKLYDDMRKRRVVNYKNELIDGKNAMNVLGRLKQICVGPETLTELDRNELLTGGKADALEDILYGIGSNKIIVFSQYARAIRCVYNNAVKVFGKKEAVAIFTGEDSQQQRLKERQRFQEDKCRVILLTMGVGSEGHDDLKIANMGCFLDVWWNPAINLQAAGRLDRNGQLNPVTILNINARNTAEDRVWQKLESKQGLFDAAIPVTEVERIALEELE